MESIKVNVTNVWPSRKRAMLILLRLKLLIPFALCLSGHAFAQYAGGTMTGGSGGGSSNSGMAIGVGAGAAAAVGAGVLYWKYHNAPVTGCVQSTDDGMRLIDEKSKKAYALIPNGADLKAGERVKVRGKRFNSSAGTQTFQAKKVVKDLGACDREPTASAAHSTSP